ncbi:hypothetical protein BD410DRAFT_687863, partial [Rickenella mellea]
LAEFGTSWRNWWKGLQPEWRDGGKDWPLERYLARANDEGWSHVARGGKNGFHIVIVTLLWWIKAAEEPADIRAWWSALEDVEWCLCQVVE